MFREAQQFGKYTLIRKLGRGGFGEVWLAERKSKFVTTKVAVKLPLDEQVNHEAIAQEATLWEQASGHSNVLPIIEADEYDGQILIASEYAPDGSLADRLKLIERFPIKQAVEMTIGILNGLEYLHSKRIIHRDIKPQNILLQGNTPKLADFGISRAMKTTAISSTISGTDAYLSPESFKGIRNVQTDIWSVGIVLYQLIKGHLPFAQENPYERMFAILTEDVSPLPDGIPQELKEIINKTLSKKPEGRYKTAAEMCGDLERFHLGESVAKFSRPQTFENLSQLEKSGTEVETIVRQPKVFKPIEARDNKLSGIVWKMGTNWGGRQNPNFYFYIKDNQIVLTIDRFRYSVGDLVLITDGFTVKAIVKIVGNPKPLESNPEYKPLFDHYKVMREHDPLYAKSEWYELKPYEQFQYKVQRGGSKVNQPEIKQIAFDLWNNRNKEITPEELETQVNTLQSDNSTIYTPNKRWEQEETGLSNNHPIRGDKESETYWNTRVLTHSILGKHYRTPQENVRILTEYLNSKLPSYQQIIESRFIAPTNENLKFHTKSKTVSFNAHEPISKDDFLRNFNLK